ncbi:site-specific integrase [Neobacillus pocheonensis]|uniref:tyrosine-type recombinase/integrase n=1 Tax=Neobacillus pocheonensis TaxID=363869 RepID=UPI003D2E5F16
MSKKKNVLTITEDLSDLFIERPSHRKPEPNRLTIEKALTTITRQMEISGNRPRTISDYSVYVHHFTETMGVTYLNEITADAIYEWLAAMDVSNQTKLTRLKCLKAFLSRCFSNGWIDTQFWKPITIRVDSNVKEGATEREIRTLLSLLDLGDFVQLRDATAALLMFKTGIRINTIVHLENRHIDFNEKLLRLDGAIMKNHDQLLLPFDDTLHRLIRVLVRQNDAIRQEYGVVNNYVFITKQGGVISNSPTHNNIQKRLNKYSKEFGLRNINPHALRRGFAKSLLNKGANIAEISKALGHSNLAVTTQYLHLDKEEVAENLRKYL